MSLASVATALAVVACCITAGLAGAVAAGDTVSARRPLRGNDTVVSAQGKFELGLFSPGGSGRFYLGIWYKNVPVQTVIWVGNRVNPLSRCCLHRAPGVLRREPRARRAQPILCHARRPVVVEPVVVFVGVVLAGVERCCDA